MRVVDRFTAARTTSMLLLTAFAAGCEPTAEDLVDEGGQAPSPTATLRGVLTYSGPAPSCDANGVVQGVALLSLFSTLAPPPPQGSGQPITLLLIRGPELFRNGTDCRTGDDIPVITRSAEFTWPGIPLDGLGGGPGTYVLLATWDDDRNFNPLFRVRSSPTLGDLVGGATEDPAIDPAQTVIEVGPAANFPHGQVVDGVTVAIVVPVTTEVPLTRLSTTTRPLDSVAPLPLTFDPDELLRQILALTDTALTLPDVNAEPYSSALEVAGLDLATDPVSRAWYLQTIDLDADGAPDLHPVLGPVLQIPALTPIVAFSRARTPAEVAAQIPEVLLFGQPVETRSVKADRVSIAVPPVAIVNWNPLVEDCAIPYVPPGNIKQAYEGRPVVCTELPAGVYDVNVVHGLAGARPAPAGPDVSETGQQLVGGLFSGQLWTIPNELGPADPRYSQLINQLDAPGAEETLTIAEQGPAGRFLVIDSDPTDDLPSERPTCLSAFDAISGSPAAIDFEDMPRECCSVAVQFCGLPLCPVRVLEDGRGAVRELTMLTDDGRPTCVPFEVPPSCCR